MKMLTTVVLLLAFSSIAAGEVSTRVCLADANTPLELADPNVLFVYRDIMVGTKLIIIVDSNIAESWDGGLYIGFTDSNYGVLSARDYNDTTFDWEGSRFEAAGDEARVQDVQDIVNSGFELYSYNSAVAGNWFVLDYTAINIGVCKVDFYDYSLSEDDPIYWDYPIYSHVFSHVRTRDFNQDTKVDFADLALLALYWQEAGCGAPDWCAGTDLNTDGSVDYDDLNLFAAFWLERTE
ncbi:dockerin type I domain-containing protein [Planctomycetota bacterium]